MELKISTSSIIKVLAVLVAAYAIFLIRDLVLALIVSVVIAAAVNPLARWLNRLRIPRVPAVLLIYLCAFGLIAGLLPFFIAPALSELVNLLSTLPSRLESLPVAAGLSDWFNSFSDNLPLNNLPADLRESVAGISSNLLQAASAIFGGFFSFILIVVLSFYLAVQPNGIENFLRILAPLGQERYVVDLWRRAEKKIGFWMQGQLLLGLLVGIIVYLGLTILGVRYALVLAMLAAIFELIPIFGPVLAAVPAAAIAFSENLTLGFLVIGLYVIIQQFENHLLSPLVVKKMVGVPAIVAILALIIGGQLAGFLGIIVSVPLAAVALEILADLEKRRPEGERVKFG